MDIDKAIKARHSVRRFTTKKPDWREIIEAIDSARLGPLAGNLQTIRVVLVSEKEKIKKIAEACQQDFVGTVEHIVVFCSDLSQVERSYSERAAMYSRQQVGAAIENFLLKITEFGLATCWIGDFVDDDVKRVLDIPDNIIVEALFPIGYEMPPKAKQETKTALDNILFFDTWKNKFMGRKISFRA